MPCPKADHPRAGAAAPAEGDDRFWSWFTTVDHKKIGILYGGTALGFFVIGGVEALLIRLQLAGPTARCSPPRSTTRCSRCTAPRWCSSWACRWRSRSPTTSSRCRSARRDVAFPRLNMFGYWVVLFGGLFIYSSFFLGGAPNGGWFGYTPLTSTPIFGGALPGPRARLLVRRHRDARHRVDDVGDQLHRHHPQHARAGHDPHAHAGVHVDDAGGRVPHRVRDADHHRGDDHGVLRPQLRHEVLPRVERRRSAAVPAPVLAVRPSRGLHPDPARHGHRLGGAAGVLAASRCSATRS